MTEIYIGRNFMNSDLHDDHKTYMTVQYSCMPAVNFRLVHEQCNIIDYVNNT
jgi:hypothetical protein